MAWLLTDADFYVLLSAEIDADTVIITDTGSYYTGTEVETALQEVGHALGSHNLNGFENSASSTLSWDNATRTLTLTPTGTDYYWINGVRYSYSSAKTCQIDNASGIHAIYLSGSSLLAVQNPTHAQIDTLITANAIVAWVYWSANDSDTHILGDERHGIVMSCETHHWIHDNIGATYREGATLSEYTLATSSDAAISFDLTDIKFYDEDIEHTISDGVATNQYEQVLTGDAEIPVLYKDNTDGTWTQQAASTLPYIVDGGSVPTYNYDDGDGTWSQAQLTTNRYMLYHLIATNDWEFPVKMVQGSEEYTTLAGAREGVSTEIINWGTMPAAEFVILYTFIVRRVAGGTKNLQIIEIEDFRFTRVTGATYQPTDHGTLTGLGDDDHTQYIKHDLATAVNDFLVASGSGVFVKKTLAETGAILEGDIDHGNIQGLGDDDHTQYILHSLATAANDFLVASGSGVFVKKTLAEVGAILETDLDHGSIQGLGDDDHTIYIKADATRAFTGVPTGKSAENIPEVVIDNSEPGTTYPGLIWVDADGDGFGDKISDDDDDTKVETEAAADEDLIRFTAGGKETARVTSTAFNVYGDEATDAVLQIAADQGDDNADWWAIRNDQSDNVLKIQTYASGSYVNTVWISTSGEVNLPKQPSVSAQAPGQSNISKDTWTTVTFTSPEIFDVNGDFASNTFTAPVGGKYLILFNLWITDVPSDMTNIWYRINTSNRAYTYYLNPTHSGGSGFTHAHETVHVVADMDASDTATCQVYQQGGTDTVLDINSNTRMMVQLLS